MCLDVINQSWTPLYSLSNVFDTFLPQLLTYPNPMDPLNGEAATLFISKPNMFAKRVRQYIKKYASCDLMEVSDSSSSDEYLSSMSEDDTD